ncbi:MAG: hypothetical protein LUE17_04515 [Planctomycetaceae bacterium]|nr:hypothetical protein [Planctomycetaceae bacterium]
MDVRYFRSDETSLLNNDHFAPSQLISFTDLLLRWNVLSHYTIPFFTVLRMRDGVPGYYLHFLEAISIGFQCDPDKPKQTDAEAIMIQCRIHPPYNLRIRYEYLYEKFDMLYFLREEVEAIEKEYREIRIENQRLIKENPLNKTTRKNLRQVASLTLRNIMTVDGLPEESNHSFRDRYMATGHHWWSGEREKDSFPLDDLDDLPEELIGANLPAPFPKTRKHKKNNDLKPIEEVIAVLKQMGIRQQKKSAKIIYHLYPNLTQEEIGKLYPGRLEESRTKNSDRDRARVLLGLKPSSKPPSTKGKPTT